MISHVTLPVKLDYVLIDILIDVLISQIMETLKKIRFLNLFSQAIIN